MSDQTNTTVSSANKQAQMTQDILEFVKLFPQLPPVESITLDDTVVQAYMEGRFCGYCPAFDSCPNVPALMHRALTL